MRRNIRKYLNLRTGVKEKRRKPDTMKCLCLVLLLCFVAGIITANLMDKEQLGGFTLFHTYFIEKFKYNNIQSVELFFYILKERIPVMVLLLMLAMTSWGTVAGFIFLSWQGYAAGFLMAASVASYGIKGVLLIGTAAFPQYLIYIPLYISYMYLVVFFQKRLSSTEGRRASGVEGIRLGHKKELFIFLTIAVLIVSVYVTGIFLEGYVNPYLLKKILKIF